MDAHGLHFCDRTTPRALAVLHSRLDIPDPADLRPRLVLDMSVAAFHCALRTWSATPEDALSAHTRSAFLALSGAATFPTTPRRPAPDA